ncbi:MAG: hypothetical protein ACTSSA_08410 [Candidatus Freyarchaeota archaeon]|nr:hypothetical protein [Candidatus Freyarchaeota archaeon]
MSETKNIIICGVCGKRRRISDIVYVNEDSGVAVCSECAAKISIDLVDWERRGLDEIDERLRERKSSR